MPTAHSIQSIDFLTAFSESVLAYPIILSTHLACIALFGGMILMANLRLLGLNFKSLTITEMVSSLRPWKRLGAIVMIATGLLLATSEAEKYAPNPLFWAKMVILGLIGVHALIFRPIVYNRTEELDRCLVIPTKEGCRDSLVGPLDLHVYYGKTNRLLGLALTSPFLDVHALKHCDERPAVSALSSSVGKGSP